MLVRRLTESGGASGNRRLQKWRKPGSGANSRKLKSRPCPGACYCNFFGCNCDPCYPPYGNCPVRRELELDQDVEVQEVEVGEEQKQQTDEPCADYNEWKLGMTQEERVRRLAEKYCVDDDGDDNLDVYEAMPNIDNLAEALVDLRVGDQDGSMSCEEFNKAYFDVDATDHLCLHVNSTPYCEFDDSCGTTEAEETTTSGAHGNGVGPDAFAFWRWRFCFGSFAPPQASSFLPLVVLVVPLLI